MKIGIREVHLITPILNSHGGPTRVLFLADPFNEVIEPTVGLDFDAEVLGYPEGERLFIPMSNVAVIRSYEGDQ